MPLSSPPSEWISPFSSSKGGFEPHMFDSDDEVASDTAVVRSSSVFDPIHNYIPLSAKLKRFIDTKHFQRLRNIKQLGTSYYVWPGASHNRFEHCLGVAHLARVVSEHLRRVQPSLCISDRDIDCVEIAGLCHDLGHGPWSHVWDGQFIPVALKGKHWTHEIGSEMMFDALVTDNEIDLSAADRTFIKALISGDASKCPDEKPFLFDIVANKRNGLDVDKFDYIQRDSYSIGDAVRISIQRVIDCSRVLNNQICYDIKVADQLYEICATRFRLHKLIYAHKATTAIQFMLVDALLAADPILNFSNDVFDPSRFLHLTDNLMPMIEASRDPLLGPAQAILERIHIRDLYKCVDHKAFDWTLRKRFEEMVTPEKIVQAAKRTALENPAASSESDNQLIERVKSLQPEHVIVNFNCMHYGMKDKNPLDEVMFYSKRNPHVCAKANRGDYSTLTPSTFAEIVLRIYTRDVCYFGLIQAGYRAVLSEMGETADSGDESASNSNSTSTSSRMTEGVESGVSSALDRGLTPPLTEPPSTPPKTTSLSRHASGNLGTATGGRKGLAKSSSFGHNLFTTVPPEYVPTSPTRRSSGGGVGVGVGGGRPLKRQREEENNHADEGAGGRGKLDGAVASRKRRG